MSTFYSFDVFDTLIQRNTLEPAGVFFRVRECMRASGLNFPEELTEDYPTARMGAESNVRYAYRSTYSGSREITFDEIFLRLSAVYNLDAEQICFLMNTELQSELDACEPCIDGLARLLALLEKGERVVMISDMYLPESFIRQLLHKVEPRLDNVPLYLSSSHGFQKMTGELYSAVSEQERNVDFSKWVHYGDNHNADGVAARSHGINAFVHEIPTMNAYERALIRDIGSYNSYLVAALMARYRFSNRPSLVEEFVYTRVSLYLVTYVFWVLKDAIDKGIRKLYFISRDGYHLKRIADSIIQELGLAVSTYYLYGSRRVWWVSSFIENIDPDFFRGVEGLKEPCKFKDLLGLICLTLSEFHDLFPSGRKWGLDSTLELNSIKSIVKEVKVSERYKAHLLKLGRSRRDLVCSYLRESVDVDSSIAFVEYWGRGFTQACLGRLLSCAYGKSVSTEFYYARSIYQNSVNEVRHNFTVNKASLLPVERLFANFPYETVTAYEDSSQGVKAVMMPREYDAALFFAMEHLLPKFSVDLCRAGFFDRIGANRILFDWAISNFNEDLKNDVVWKSFGHLKYAVRAFGHEMEFAPAFKTRVIWGALRGESLETESVDVSLRRSHWLVCYLYKSIIRFKSWVGK